MLTFLKGENNSLNVISEERVKQEFEKNSANFKLMKIGWKNKLVHFEVSQICT